MANLLCLFFMVRGQSKKGISVLLQLLHSAEQSKSPTLFHFYQVFVRRVVSHNFLVSGDCFLGFDPSIFRLQIVNDDSFRNAGVAACADLAVFVGRHISLLYKNYFWKSGKIKSLNNSTNSRLPLKKHCDVLSHKSLSKKCHLQIQYYDIRKI